MGIEKKIVRFHNTVAMVREYLMQKLKLAGLGYVGVSRTTNGYVIKLYVDRPYYVRKHLIKEMEKDIEQKFGWKSVRIALIRPPEDLERKLPSEMTNEELMFIKRLNPWIMASRIARNLEKGWRFRKAAYAALRAMMGAGADGAQVIISGKITGERARTVQFVAGKIKYCGEISQRIMLEGFDTALTKAGVIGVTVRIMRPGAKLPDRIHVPRREEIIQIIQEEGKGEEEAKQPEGGVESAGTEA